MNNEINIDLPKTKSHFSKTTIFIILAIFVVVIILSNNMGNNMENNNKKVKLETNQGDIVIELYGDMPSRRAARPKGVLEKGMANPRG